MTTCNGDVTGLFSLLEQYLAGLRAAADVEGEITVNLGGKRVPQSENLQKDFCAAFAMI